MLDAHAGVRAEIDTPHAETKVEFVDLRADIKANTVRMRWILVLEGFILIAVVEPIVVRYFG